MKLLEKKGLISLKEKKLKSEIIFFDIQLFENNLSNNFDIIITILSNKKERWKRLKDQKNIKRGVSKNIKISNKRYGKKSRFRYSCIQQ